MKFIIKVPGSSANLGSGFDTLALAISIYLIIYVNTDGINNYRIVNESDMDIDISENNLILKTAQMVAKLFKIDLPFVEIKIRNHLPLKRGMGSSSAAIVAGIVLADRLCNLMLSKEQILNIGFLLEPHVDNLSASVYGNLTISMINLSKEINIDKYRELFKEGKIRIEDIPMICSSISLNTNSCINMVLLIPEYELETSKAREILPDKYIRQDVIDNIQRSTMLPYILTGDLMIDNNIRKNLFKDSLHQLYRGEIIPGIKSLFDSLDYLLNTNINLLGLYLSGAGPSIALLYTGRYTDLTHDILNILRKNSNFNWSIKHAKIDNNGYDVYGYSYVYNF